MREHGQSVSLEPFEKGKGTYILTVENKPDTSIACVIVTDEELARLSEYTSVKPLNTHPLALSKEEARKILAEYIRNAHLKILLANNAAIKTGNISPTEFTKILATYGMGVVDGLRLPLDYNDAQNIAHCISWE